jgi:hypothetical protein
MPIVEEYDVVAKRLRELKTRAPKGANEITELEQWRDIAKETARAYVEDRVLLQQTECRRRRRHSAPFKPMRLEDLPLKSFLAGHVQVRK